MSHPLHNGIYLVRTKRFFHLSLGRDHYLVPRSSYNTATLNVRIVLLVFCCVAVYSKINFMQTKNIYYKKESYIC
jgi:hypothetical protein